MRAFSRLPMSDLTRMSDPILAICLAPDAATPARLAQLRRENQETHLVLLTTPGAADALRDHADEVWAEGIARGPSRFLALVRRISWMSFAHVHVLDGARTARFMRFCVWPQPCWHPFSP